MRSPPKKTLDQMGQIIDYHLRHALAVRGIDFSELDRGVTQRSGEASTEIFYEGERILKITHEHTREHTADFGWIEHDTLNFDHMGMPEPKPPRI